MASVFGSAQAPDSAEMQPALYARRESSSCHGNPENGGAVKKRRLTAEQARSLEMSFEREKKLQQQRKFQLAFELGLKPRQVAVWYQNRRARWKAKQLEQEYDILKQRYDQVLLEKQELEAEVNRLAVELRAGERQLKDENLACGTEEDEAWNNRSSSICSGGPAKPCKELAGRRSDNEQAVPELQQGTKQLWGHLFQNRASSEDAERGRRSNYRQIAAKSGDKDETLVFQQLYSSDLLAVDGQQVVTIGCLDWLNF